MEEGIERKGEEVRIKDEKEEKGDGDRGGKGKGSKEARGKDREAYVQKGAYVKELEVRTQISI